MAGRIAGCGVVMLVALTAVTAFDARQHAEAFVALLGVASLAYVAVLRLVARMPVQPGRGSLAACLLLGVAWRVVLLGSAPLVSDDVYRYVWDGRVQQHGLNPYAAAPADPALAALHTGVTRRIDPTNAVLPSIYPPLAQRFFLGVTLLGESARAMALAVVVCDLLLAGVLWRWLTVAGRNPWWVLAYAWHPLVAIEGAAGAHIDVLGALLLVAGVHALSQSRSLLAAIAVAGSIAVKLLPVVLLPLLWRRVRLIDALAGAMLVVLVYIPFAGEGVLPIGSLGTYVAQWRFNGPLFRGVAALAGPVAAAGLALGAGIAMAALMRRTRRRDDPAAWAWPMASAIVLMPAVYPWYLVWLTPFLGPASTWPLAVWTLASMATYVVWTPQLAGAGWVLPGWVEPVEYGLVAAAGAWTFWAWRRSRRADRPARGARGAPPGAGGG